MQKWIRTFFKDHRRDFCEWSNKIPIDTPMEEVKIQLPHYIQVDWQNPQPLGDGLLYPVIKIKGHKKGRSGDFLGFVNELYSGHVFIK